MLFFPDDERGVWYVLQEHSELQKISDVEKLAGRHRITLTIRHCGSCHSFPHVALPSHLPSLTFKNAASGCTPSLFVSFYSVVTVILQLEPMLTKSPFCLHTNIVTPTLLQDVAEFYSPNVKTT